MNDGRTDKIAWEEVWRKERARIADRRKAVGIAEAPDHPSQTIGLALSGGGVRSATFALGVMQSLARQRVLECVDYLSTASGGGYIGAFFASLFARSAGAEAREPYDVMRGPCQRPDPPPEPPNPPGPPPKGWQLWWLRNSGRYLAPTGAGDYLYAVALALRNLLAIHYVLGASVVMSAVPVIALDMLLLGGLRRLVPFWPEDFGAGLAAGVAAMTLLWVLPAGLAYFATEMPKKQGLVGRWWLSRTWLLFGAAGVASLAIAAGARLGWLDTEAVSPLLAAIVFAMGTVFTLAVLLLAVAAACIEHGGYVPGGAKGGETTPQGKMLTTRVVLTKWLATGLKSTLVVACAALLVYLSFRLIVDGREWWGTLLAAGGGGSALLVMIGKQGAALLSRREGSGSKRLLSFDRIALLLGALFLALLLLGWHAFTWAALALFANQPLEQMSDYRLPLAVLGAAVLAVGLVTGRSFAFVNLTTIQNLYSSRLARAYLGASNPARSTIADARWTRISDTHPADNLNLDVYYDAVRCRAPLHVVNVTLNETVSPTDPLVQRDRHGRPLALSPDHYCIDGEWRQRPDAASAAKADAQKNPQHRAPETLQLGSWIGISGAAFSPGAGRGTTLGKSLLLGLSNVRLGYWWRAGWLAEAPASRLAGALRGVVALFQTQSYLLAELLGRYSGRYAPYWFLSDGGHFDNTALYELLRRRVGLIIATDGGADASYEQDDVANLMRLARIDFGCEFIRLDAAAVRASAGAGAGAAAPLADHLWPPERGDRGAFDDGQCISVYWVRRDGDAAGPAGGSALIVIKPRLIAGAPVDVRQYARVHADFPQQTTADQFFEEEQWESYRQLGERIGALLPLGDARTTAEAGRVRAGLEALRTAIATLATRA